MVLFTLLFFHCGVVDGQVVILVPQDFGSIQKALANASNGDEILVSKGTYSENIDFLGKAVTVRSVEGPDVTTINAGFIGSAVVFINGEGPDSVLEGFTLTNGTGTLALFPSPSDLVGGAIYCQFSSPTIVDNIITGNTALFGGGIECDEGSSPTIRGNLITGNTAVIAGGGIDVFRVANASIIDNIITGNVAQALGAVNPAGGGGISMYNRCSPLIQGNIISDNTAQTALARGGGILCFFDCSPLLLNNRITGNIANSGGGVYCQLHSHARLFNCTLSGNTAVIGGALFCDALSSPIVRNSILWGNMAPTEISAGFGSNLVVTFSDVAGGFPGMGSNIDADPLFVDPDGPDDIPGNEDDDYHLQPDSPCIDVGNNGVHWLQESDGDGENRIQDGQVDIGWDEVAAACTYALPDGFACAVSGDEVSLSWTNNASYDFLAIVRDGTLVATLPGGSDSFSDQAVATGLHVYSLNPELAGESCAGPGCRAPVVGCWYVDDLSPGMPPSGTGTQVDPYTSIQFAIDHSNTVDGSTLLVEAGDYVENIDFRGREITLRSIAELPEVSTIDGSAQTRGANFASTVVFSFREGPGAVIEGFRITGGEGTHYIQFNQRRGGGIHCPNSEPTIIGNLISGNSLANVNAASFGAGIFCSYRAPTIRDNIIEQNEVNAHGGGIACFRNSGVSIIGNIVTGNSADIFGSGIYLLNNTGARVTSNTVADNVNFGAGISSFNSQSVITNTIVWGNSVGIATPSGAPPAVNYCDVQGGFEGIGNFSIDPLLSGDYHLQPGSPCIDVGTNDIPDLPATDIDGEPRVMGCIVDVGADELTQPMKVCDLIRGDVDADGTLNTLIDAIYLLNFGFQMGAAPPCMDTADVDDDATVDPLVDGFYLLLFGFSGGPPPPPPYPDCGVDTTPDALGCLSYTCP